MSIYVLRLRDGNCLVVNALNEDHARKNVQQEDHSGGNSINFHLSIYRK